VYRGETMKIEIPEFADWKEEAEFWDRIDTASLMEEEEGEWIGPGRVKPAPDQVEEMLSDPDEGLELREEIEARLRRSLAEKRGDTRGIPAQEVAAQLGLEYDGCGGAEGSAVGAPECPALKTPG
jgi:hypothetical protein